MKENKYIDVVYNNNCYTNKKILNSFYTIIYEIGLILRRDHMVMVVQTGKW